MAVRFRSALVLVAGNIAVLTMLWGPGLVVLELYFRYGRDATDSIGLGASTARWLHRHFTLNGWGYRDDIEYALRRASGKRRVTFVGDSFTAGHGIKRVEDRFANLVLRAVGKDWEVHVFADVGLDTADELAMMAGWLGQGYQTDEIVVVYCLNDLPISEEKFDRATHAIYAQFENPGFLLRHSALLDALHLRWVLARVPQARGYYDFLRAAYDGPELEQEKALMGRFRDLARAKGIGFRIVTFPFVHALGPRYAFRAVHEKLGHAWASLGIAHLDLLPALEARAAEGLAVSEIDAHPNERANRIAADVIAPFVMARSR